MPSRRLPNSTPAILRLFSVASATYRNTPKPIDLALNAEIWAKLDDSDPASLHSRFKKEANEVDVAQAAQAPLTSAHSQAAARLTLFCSHFHQVLDLGIARGDFALGARSYYGRDVSAASLPSLSTYDDVKAAAEKIVAGESDRQAAEGAAFVPMALPSAAQVQSALTTYLDAQSTAQKAQVKTDDEREDVSALYAEAQALAVDVCDAAEYFYRKDPDASSRRAKCRRWGVVYLNAEGEPTEPDDANPPAPSNPPVSPAP